MRTVFTSESVGEGHPDKVADLISDSILDACLAQDPNSRVACETLVKDNHVVLAGEITTTAKVDYEGIVRAAVRSIGYIKHEPNADGIDKPDALFYPEALIIDNFISTQSPDIAQGVDARAAEGKASDEQGAGDQGIMFGYATDETESMLPLPIELAHNINRHFASRRKLAANYPNANAPEVVPNWMRPDCKSQVSVEYACDGTPLGITSIVFSTQHSEDVDAKTIRKYCESEIRSVIPENLLREDTKFYINPTGRFVTGGPHGDAGVTGRKIIVDTYGGMGRHGGGAFSGKDCSKVDRSGAYMCRWVAKHIVAAGLAHRCEIQVSYAIGEPEPISIRVDTFGTNNIYEGEIAERVAKVFSFKPADMERELHLRQPFFAKTTNYGHFGKPELPWEVIDPEKVAALRELR